MLQITRFSSVFFGVIWHVRRAIVVMCVWLLIGAAAITYVERMSFADAVHFSFVTGLTIGYGDIVVKTPVGRFIAILIGFTGILFTGLVIAAAVETVSKTLHHSNRSD